MKHLARLVLKLARPSSAKEPLTLLTPCVINILYHSMRDVVIIAPAEIKVALTSVRRELTQLASPIKAPRSRASHSTGAGTPGDARLESHILTQRGRGAVSFATHLSCEPSHSKPMWWYDGGRGAETAPAPRWVTTWRLSPTE